MGEVSVSNGTRLSRAFRESGLRTATSGHFHSSRLAATYQGQAAVDWIASSLDPIICKVIKCYAERATRPAMAVTAESLANCSL
jgi:hypothetical protein